MAVRPCASAKGPGVRLGTLNSFPVRFASARGPLRTIPSDCLAKHNWGAAGLGSWCCSRKIFGRAVRMVLPRTNPPTTRRRARGPLPALILRSSCRCVHGAFDSAIFRLAVAAPAVKPGLSRPLTAKPGRVRARPRRDQLPRANCGACPALLLRGRVAGSRVGMAIDGGLVFTAGAPWLDCLSRDLAGG